MSPSTGLAPLLVRFSVTTPNATTPNLAWTFGDGAYLNGSFQDVQSPAHTYDRPGSFSATVAALYGGGVVTASASIVVEASNLSASLSVSPPNGTAPLTVWLNGTPDGGSGTYIAFVWGFGDGHQGSGLSVEYTYASPGTFVANFTVTDTRSARAYASVTLHVAAAGDPLNDSGAGTRNSGNGSGGGLALSPPIVAGSAALGAIVLVGIGAWVWTGRRRPGAPTATIRSVRSSTLPPDPAPASTPLGPVRGPTAVLPTRPDGGEPAELFDAAMAAPPSPAVFPPRAPRTYDFVGTRQLSFRVLTLLLDLVDDRTASHFSPAGTQAGLAEQLGVGQSAVSKVLHQLVLGGVVEVASAHVAGASRRVRVYRLTPKGDRLARALRESPHERGSAP